MAGSRIKGITIEIDGDTTGLDKALQGVNKQSRDLQGQLNDVNRLLKFNPGNTTLLAQKQKLLTDQIEATRQKLNQLKQAESQVQQQFAEGKISEKQYQAFQREIVATEGKLDHFEGQLSDVNQALKTTGRSASQLGKDFKKSFDEAKKSAGNTFDQLKRSGTVITGLGAVMAGAFGLGVKAAADQQQQMAALETAFHGNKKAAQDYYKWAQAYGKNTPFETSDVVDATIKLKSYGINAKDTLTDIGNMAAGMGKPLDQAIEAVADAQTGELERLKEFGITKNMLIAQAKTMGNNEIVNAKGQITNMKGLNDALFAIMEERFKGGMDRQSKTLQGQLSALQDSITQILQAMGNALMPIITPIAAFLQQLADGFNNLSPGMQTTIAVIGALIAALALIVGPLLLLIGFLPQIAAGIALIFTPAGAIVALVIAIVAAISGLIIWLTNLYNTNAAFRNNVQAIWQSISAVIQSVMATVMSVVTTVMSAVWSFISSIVSQITAFWKQNGDQILAAAQNVWTVISAIIQVAMTIIKGVMWLVWPLIKSLIVDTWNAIQNVINGALKIILNVIKLFAALFTGDWQGVWDAIKGILSGAVQALWGLINLWFVGKILGVFKIFGRGALSALQLAWDGIKSATSSAFRAVVDFITKPLQGIKLFEIGKQIISGLINGIKGMAGEVWNTVKGIADGVTGAFKKLFKIHSPSHVMRDEIGFNVGEGVRVGMLDSLQGIGQAAQKMTQAALPKIPNPETANQQTTGATTSQSQDDPQQTPAGVIQGDGFSFALYITNFNNYRAQDIKQLVQEIAAYMRAEKAGGLKYEG
jgi:phage-related minor tail protein